MSDKKIMAFVYQVDGGDLGDVDLDVVVEMDSWGSGEDFDCSAKLVSVRIDSMDMLEDMPEATVSKIEEAACERFMDELPPCWEPGLYVWKGGPKKGKVVEVLGAVSLPGRVEWVLVTRERRERILSDPVVVLVSQEELSLRGPGDMILGETALEKIDGSGVRS